MYPSSTRRYPRGLPVQFHLHLKIMLKNTTTECRQLNLGFRSDVFRTIQHFYLKWTLSTTLTQIISTWINSISSLILTCSQVVCSGSICLRPFLLLSSLVALFPSLNSSFFFSLFSCASLVSYSLPLSLLSDNCNGVRFELGLLFFLFLFFSFFIILFIYLFFKLRFVLRSLSRL